MGAVVGHAEQVPAQKALLELVRQWLDEVEEIRGVAQVRGLDQVLDWVHGACAYARCIGVIDVGMEQDIAEGAYSRYLGIVRSRRAVSAAKAG